jgi:hypothetical protein
MLYRIGEAMLAQTLGAHRVKMLKLDISLKYG